VSGDLEELITEKVTKDPGQLLYQELLLYYVELFALLIKLSCTCMVVNTVKQCYICVSGFADPVTNLLKSGLHQQYNRI